ncbi:MAG TPA: response regulator [Bacteriovoracaceae bacterium]|nr:response regulator [Bacteriovoracaceae bacterium]
MKKKILIIDDTKEIHDCLRMALEYEDYDVSSAMNGQDAINILTGLDEKSLPDLILLDLMMPIMDGYQFLDKMGGPDNAKFKKIPIIVMSAKADVVFSGPNFPTARLKKPMTLDELFGSIKKNLR